MTVAPMRLARLALPAMRVAGGGRIINVSSIAGVLASPQSSPYSMTKYAIEAFTKSLRGELAPHGIDVTKVNPGPYATGFNDRMVDTIPTFIDEGDASAHETHAVMVELILGDQRDPAEVATALADLAEAAETPEETFLPPEIKELLGGLA